MRFNRFPARISLIVALCASVALAAPGRSRQAATQGQAAAPQGQAAAAQTPGEPPLKNIQVLQGIPREKVLEGMQYITVALGARCDFCHNTKDFSNDDKHEKQTARQMMKMLFAIDKDNFNGRTEVSCYTCHQGHPVPVGAPLPFPAEAGEAAPLPAIMSTPERIESAAGTPIPTLDSILAKYKQAMGSGENAPSSLLLEAERTSGVNQPAIPQQIYEKAPNKVLIVSHQQQGVVSTGFDGTKAWVATARGSRELSGMDALMVTRAELLNPVGALDAYTGKRLTAMIKLGDHQTYLVVAKAPDANIEQLYFDADSGLLIRRVIVYRTIFGALYYAINYSDYRPQNGLEIPFETQWWAGGQGWTETVKSVQANATVTDAQFERPAQPAQPAAASPGKSR
jgi:hypothetical protein